MASKKLRISDLDLQRLVFSEVYQRYSEPKAQRQAFEIMEAAIRCLAKTGFDQITLAMIARDAEVTRPLLKYYFADLAEITNSSIKYIRLVFQKRVVDSIKTNSNASDCLVRYIDAHFQWVADNRRLATVWLAFLHRASGSKHSRALNTVAVEAGTDRIHAIIEQGINSKLFFCNNIESTARAVQTLVTGALIHVLTDEITNLKIYNQQIRMAALNLVGAKVLN